MEFFTIYRLYTFAIHYTFIKYQITLKIAFH